MTKTSDMTPLSRRKLLAKIGLGAGVAYVAPVMLHMSPARASGVSAASAPSRNSAPSPVSRSSAPSPVSRSSAPSAASRNSGPSRNSRLSRASATPQPHDYQHMPLWWLRMFGLI